MKFSSLLRAHWDRVLAVVLFVVGAIVLVIGVLGIRQETLVAAQLPYLLSSGVTSLFLVGLGTAAWLSADVRDVWRKLDDIEHRLGQPPDGAAGEAGTE